MNIKSILSVAPRRGYLLSNIRRMLTPFALVCVLALTGCTSPLLSSDPKERRQAVAAISDNKQLFFIAMNLKAGIKGEWPELYSETHIRRGEYPDDVRVAAVEQLRNMDYLLMCASWNDGAIYVDPGYDYGKFEYCGKTYYCKSGVLCEAVMPGNVVRTAAIKRLSDFATFKEVSKSLDAKAKERILPKSPSGVQRGASSDGNAFIDYYGHFRPGNPLDKALRTALEKLKQPDAAAEFLCNAAEGGQGIAPETFGYAVEHLEGVSSKVASSILQKIFKEYYSAYTKNEWLPILIRYIDDLELETAIAALEVGGDDAKIAAAVVSKIKSPETAEKLLSARDRGGSLLLKNANQRRTLVTLLPEDKIIKLVMTGIKKHSVYEWKDCNLTALELAIGVMPSIKDTKSAVRIVSAILENIAEYRKACKKSLTMNWYATDDDKARELMGRLPKLSDDVIIALICLDDASWAYFMPSVTEDVAYKVLTQGKAKSAELEAALIKKLPADKIDMQVYNGVKTDGGKKAALAAMPAELKKTAQAADEKAFASVLEKAKVAAKETFELRGFYLGMEWEDMKHVLSHHFPDYTITERRDGDEKDADYVVYIPNQRAPFCYAAAKDKKVYQFNFGKAILKKWYNYDVQTYMEWARKYSSETRIDMRFKMLEKDTTVYEMDMSRSYRVWFHQESYQYKHNTKEYRLTYFGEEKDFTLEGGFGGDLIKEMAAPRFRYVRGDPGSLRAAIERD